MLAISSEVPLRSLQKIQLFLLSMGNWTVQPQEKKLPRRVRDLQTGNNNKGSQCSNREEEVQGKYKL